MDVQIDVGLILTPSVEDNIVACAVEDILRVAKALDDTFLSIRSTAPGNSVSCCELDTVYADGAGFLEIQHRRVGVLRVNPSSTIASHLVSVLR